MSGKYDKACAINETLKIRCAVSRGGAPRNLTGYTAAMQICDMAGEVALDMAPYITINESAGLISILAPVDTLTVGEDYIYDLLLIGAGETQRLLHGSIIILRGVTNSG